jgi:hypothetical protein
LHFTSMGVPFENGSTIARESAPGCQKSLC